jgi:Na+/proline symporter
MKTTNPTTQAHRRYLREFTLAIVAYIAILAASVYGLNHGIEGFAKYLVAVVPAVPLVGIFIAGVRWLQATDEFQRQTTVTALAIAGGLTALICVTYGFLENAGLPKMSIWISYLIFMSIWGIATPILQRAQQ